MKLYHLSWNELHKRWTLKTEDGDIWLRSSYYKFLAIKKAIKYCRNVKPSMLVIHTKDGHQEETRQYLAKG
jgi:hypothetical protein